MKRKLLLFMFTVLLTGWHVNGQVLIYENFDAGVPAGWTANSYYSTTTSACDIGSIYQNLYDFSAATNLESTSQIATGSDIEVSVDYKVVNYSDYTAMTGNFGVYYLQYSIDNGSAWINYDTINQANHTASDQCATRTFTIAAADVPNASVFKWRLNGTWSAGDYYLYIDNFSAIEQVACIAPNGLFGATTSTTSADLGWTENGSATAWNIEYGVAGFGLGNGTLVGVTSTSHTLTGLTFGSTYEYYVQADCGGGDLSGWTGPFTFQIEYCSVSTTYSGDYLSAVSSNGAIANVSYTASSQPSGAYASETSQSFQAFETQVFDLNTTYDGGGNSVNIWVDWNNDLNFDATELVATEGSSAASKVFSITVPLGTPQGDYRMRVRADYGTTSNPPACGEVNFGSTIDFKLTIIASPSCFPPSALNISNMTSTSTDLAWTENGSALEWQVEYGTNGFTQGSGTIEVTNTNPHSITITPSTEYDFYVRAICGANDTSLWAGPYSFDNMYCVPTNSYSTSYYINDVKTSGAIQNLNNTGTGFTAGGYADYTGTDTLIVYPGQTISVTLQHPSSTYGYTMWVDWNNNFSFADAGESVLVSGYQSTPYTFNLTIPAAAPQGTFRLRVRNAYLSDPAPACGSFDYGEAEDYAITVVAAPTCLPTSGVTVSNPTTTTLDLAWTENNSATSWNIVYGPVGFAPGTGTVIPGVTTNPYTVAGLNPSTTYSFYVQSDCGGGDESSLGTSGTGATACGVVTAPYYEGFNTGTQPICTDNLSSNTSTSVSNFWKFSGTVEFGAVNNGKPNGTYAFSDGDTPRPDSMMLITPEIDVSSLTTPYLGFEWFSNNTNNPGDNVPMIVSIYNGSTWTFLDTLKGDNPKWQYASYDLSAFANDTIQVRFMTNQTIPTNAAYYNDILLDEVRVDNCLSGQDGSRDVCRLDGTINLNDNIVVGGHGIGEWTAGALNSHISNDSIFNFSTLPSGAYEVYYVEKFACIDTSVATITVFNMSSAGTGGSIAACKNAPVNLYSALSGNVDMGGTWYDYSGNQLPNSQPIAPNLPAQYNYNYIANNGVCPADTAIVEVNVGNCTWAVDEQEFTEISVYPNPTTSKLNIMNPSNTSSLKVEMLDMNGRVVLIENKALNNASEATIMIDHLERGIYTLRVYNAEGQRTFKIVKQ